MNIENADILAAIERLKAKYPNDSVAIWVKWLPRGTSTYDATPQWQFTAQIADYGETPVYVSKPTLEAAIDGAILEAGDRDPKAKLEREIAETRAKLADLYTKLNPEAMAVTCCPPDAEKEMAQ